MILKKIVFALVLSLSCNFINAQEQPSPTSASNEERTVEFTTAVAYISIDGMACQEGCADTIAKKLEDVKGIQSAEVSFATGKAVVKFDQSYLGLADIETMITETKVKDYVYTIKNSVLKDNVVR